METERRRHIRHIPLEKNAFAALGQNFAKTGKIKNISIEGLSFEYIVGKTIPASDDTQVEIFLTDMPLHIRSVQCQAIHDERISVTQMEDAISGSLTVRRVGIKFIRLTEKQKDQINMLLSLFCADSG
jgi:hypothetical protein